MSETRYSVIFRGDLVPGFTAEDVKANLVRLFRAGPETVEKLFSGRPLAIKKDLPEAQARQMLAALQKAGAQASLKPEGQAAAAPQPAEPAPRPAPAPRQPAAPAGLSVAPMDGNLVKDHEREQKSAVQVEVGHISLKPQQGNLVDESEQKRAPAARVQVPDWQLD